MSALLCAGFAAAAPPAYAATSTDLYVDNDNGACADTGPGSRAEPFCTIQAAADVAQPGQTVHVTEDSAVAIYAESVAVTRSGEPGAPITFAADSTPGNDIWVNPEPGSNPGFSLTGVHDVVITGFDFGNVAAAVAVTGSSRITVDRNQTVDSGIVLSGQTTDVTVSHNWIQDAREAGIAVGAGGVHDTIASNMVESTTLGSGISVTGSTDTAITSNTTYRSCVSGIAVAGNSTGTTIENNVDYYDMAGSSCRAGQAFGEISVSADSAAQTTEKYDTVFGGDVTRPALNWAGVKYTTVAAYRSATGQGDQDSDQNPGVIDDESYYEGRPVEGAPVIDSADPDAPGEPSTDLLGNLRVNDPLVPDKAPGGADRGAYEFPDPFAMSSSDVTPTQGPAPLPVSVTLVIDNPWSTPASYSFDFGDGTAPEVITSVSAPTARHTYAGPVTQTQFDKVVVAATLPNGRVVREAGENDGRFWQVQLNPPGPLLPALSVIQTSPAAPNTVEANSGGSTDPWTITGYTYDFGDGTAAVDTPWGSQTHQYAKPGTYPVTETERDYDGRTASSTKTITVGDAYVPLNSVRLLDTRNGTGAPRTPLGQGGTLGLQVTGAGGVPATGVQAVVLNVTVTNPTVGGYLTVYPDGSTRPLASNLNFTAGQTVPNLVTVPVGADGKVNFYNFHGNVDVVADIEGYYAYGDAVLSAGQMEDPGFLVPQQPHRLLDTRSTGGPLGANQTRAVQLTGSYGPQSGATAAVLNVTVTDPTAAGYLTVYNARTARPSASNLNFTAGKTTSNAVIVPLDRSSDTIGLYNFAGDADVIVDVEGYFTGGSDPAATSFVPMVPTRLLDTRTTGGAIQQGTSRPLVVTGDAGAAGDPVVLNVTATDATQDSYLTVYPDGAARPLASDLNFAAGETVPNLVTVPVGADGKVDFYNFHGSVDVVADAFGYYTPTRVG